MGKELRKILFVDDDEDIHMIVNICLREIPNVEVRSAFSGEEGIKCAQEFLPDLILLDVMMPNMDGVETLNFFRKIPALNKTPVIFFTAKAVKAELEAYLKYGVEDVITKPIDVQTFPQQILKIWNALNP